MHRILVIGAHPDDADVFAGGCAALWRLRGDEVLFVSLTSGDAGHHELGRDELGRRRRAEAERAAAVVGIEYRVLENHDGELLPTLERRGELVRLIRRFAPDLVLTHRPCDYHPDHRYTATLVLDSLYLVTVPLLCPDVPHLKVDPVLGYLYDDFSRPAPFRADVVVGIDRVMHLKWEMLHAHESQFYEWLPYNQGRAAVPSGDEERRKWLVAEWRPFLARPAEAFREMLAELYGRERARSVRNAEAFEIGEHGRRPSIEEVRELFPVA